MIPRNLRFIGMKFGSYMQRESSEMNSLFCFVAGVGFEPHDLRVMSPTSYQLLYPAILDCKYTEIFLIRKFYFLFLFRDPSG